MVSEQLTDPVTGEVYVEFTDGHGVTHRYDQFTIVKLWKCEYCEATKVKLKYIESKVI